MTRGLEETEEKKASVRHLSRIIFLDIEYCLGGWDY